MVYAEGVGTGRISLERFVEISLTKPAKSIWLVADERPTSRRGRCRLAILDPNIGVALKQDDMRSRSDYDPYVGFTGRGWADDGTGPRRRRSRPAG